MKTRRSIAILHLAAVMLLGASIAHAKDKSATPPAAPALTDLEQAKMENVNLKLQMLQSRADPILQERAALIKQIEEEHPGYHFDPNGGVLVKNPEPAPAGNAPPK